MSFITTIEEHRNMRKNQTTRTTLAPSSPSSPSSPLSLSSSPSSTSPQKSPTSSPRKSKPMLGLGFGGVPYRASIPICELKVPNEREKRDVGGSVMGGGAAAAGVENDKTTVSLNSSSSNNSNKTNQQEPDTPSTNSPQTPTDISEPFSYHRDLGSGKTRTRTAAAATFDSAAMMRDLNLKNNNNNTDESEEDDHNETDHNNNNNPNNNTKNNNNDHHHELNNNNNPSLFNPNLIPKPTFQDLEEPYGGTKHFMMAHGLKWYDSTDCAIREKILGQLRDMEWQNRVNDAREEFVRMGEGR